jgi:predicted SAM-dependent methyltransferase
MEKLHIGPGNTYLPGWVNVDIFDNVKADLCSTALALPYPRKSFDIIYASHVLEHFDRHIASAALGHWQDLLVDGGILRLSVPDFGAICEYYNETSDLKSLTGLLYGGQTHYLDNHHIAFDISTLTKLLQALNFKEIRRWDWRETEHSGFDDYASAYLPHLDKDNGKLMSLNLEAVK